MMQLLDKGDEYDHLCSFAPTYFTVFLNNGANPREYVRGEIHDCMAKAIDIGSVAAVQMLLDNNVSLDDAYRDNDDILRNASRAGLEMLRFISDNG